MEQELRKNFLINTLYFLTIAAGIFIFCRFLLRYLMPFVVGGAVAWLVQKPAKVICSRTGLKRSVTAGTLALTVFIAVAVLVLLICIKAVNAVAGLFEDIGGNAEMLTKLFKELKDSADSFFEKFPKEITDFLSTLYEKTLNKAAAYFTTAVSSAAGYTVKHAPEFLLSCAVAAVSACYIAADFRRLIKFARGVCGNKIYENGVKIKNILVNSVFKFAKGYLIIFGITFAELFAGLALLKINYALLLAAIISIIDILPILGTGTVLIPWAVSEIVMGNTAQGVSLAVLYLVITVVRNFAEPKIIGNQMGIKPLFTLLAMFIGIKLFGIAGIFILPITLIVVIEYYKTDETELIKNKSV